MQRIDTVDNLFSDGDPANNIKGTLLPAAILNAFQEELANVIEGFGVTLDPAQNDQLFKVLSARCVQPGDEIMLPYVPSTQQMIDRRLLERDGSSLLRTDYSELFSAIGTMYGAVDGTHFNLPDDRGLFPRIWDHGAGVDPDAATRTDRGDGTIGDNVGTSQTDEFKGHEHYFNTTEDTSLHTDPYYPNGNPWGPLHNDYAKTEGAGGDETRPKNRYKWGGIFY